MTISKTYHSLLGLILVLCSWATIGAQTKMDATLTPKFELPKSGLELERRTQSGAFFDVAGRRSVVLGAVGAAKKASVGFHAVSDDAAATMRAARRK